MTLLIEPIDVLEENVRRAVAVACPWLGPGAAVFVKPNFTYPGFREGVTTTPEMIVALLTVLRDAGVKRICVGEGEGGYNAFHMRDAFDAFGAGDWERRFGAEVVVVTDWPSFPIEARNRHGTYVAHFPAPLKHEFDGLISVPVPKVHAMTRMSGAVKNQWGLVQDPMRIRLHLAMSEILFQFHEQVERVGVVVDGRYGLTGNGPMIDGTPIDLSWTLAAPDVWTADLALAGIMNFDPKEIRYLAYALAQGIPPDECRSSWAPFRDDRFYLRPNLWNRLAKLTWHSQALNTLAYSSRASTLLHRAMYAVRHAPEELAVRGRDWT